VGVDEIREDMNAKEEASERNMILTKKQRGEEAGEGVQLLLALIRSS